MANLLHLETATKVCSVALARDGELLIEKESENEQSHGNQLTPLIISCLKEAGLTIDNVDAIALSAGPGSYTGLRIGTATAKGICYGLNIPLIAISTLAALAEAAYQVEPENNEGLIYCGAIDARRKEIYRQCFDKGFHPIGEAHSIVLDENTFAEAREKGYTIIMAGNGAEKTARLLPDENIIVSPITECSAAWLVQPAYRAWREKNFVDVAYFEPFYLKPPNITKPKPIWGK